MDLITNKLTGVFVVDLIGNGLSSRAIIKKGNLSFIDKITASGNNFYILDEDLEVCIRKNTGIYLEGKFY